MSAKNKKGSLFTTIAITKKNKEELTKRKRGFERYDDVLSRLFANQIDVFTEIILIDNELPQLHTAVLQLGDEPESLYYFDGREFIPISLENTNKLMKQPKPNFMLTKAEAEELQKLVTFAKIMENPRVVSFEIRLQDFLENQPK